MTDHIEKLKLERFHSREMEQDDLALTILHLSQCETCMEVYQAMFPEVINVERSIGLYSVEDEIGEPFHLDYDEHLRPFVDNEISAVDREIVDGHVKICGNCASMVRDLQEFRELLDAENMHSGNVGPGIFDRFVAIVRANFGTFAFAAVALFVVSTGFILYFYSGIDQGLMNSTVAGPVDPVDQTLQPVAVVDQEPIDNNSNVEKPNDKVEIAKLNLPTFLRSLTAARPGQLRGDGEAKPIGIIGPNGIALRGTPILKWRSVPGVELYDVSIFDENDEKVAGWQGIRGTELKTSNLANGRVYQWQITSSQDGSRTKFIGQGKFYLISNSEVSRIDRATDSLARGIALAEAGMVSEASVEFNKFLKANPNSQAAKSYLRQLNLRQ